MSRPLYPFTAVVGQPRMKRALLLNVVHPSLGGVLVRGHRGTAKSTAARALAALLPELDVVPGCPFRCHPDQPGCPACVSATAPLPRERRRMPVVDLPLGATEDRVVGTLSLERAVRHGERHFEPGLLAAAHRGILYVDEVNLLEDPLVDVLLDVAAMGVNVVEREGVSVSHPARFLLVGTMNPEEGDLRPQFLDRFGLCVDVEGSDDPAERAEVVRRWLEFEAAPAAFAARWQAEEERLAGRLGEARRRLARIAVSDGLIEEACALAVRSGADGHRADLALVKAAMAAAALDGDREPGARHLAEAATMALPHRTSLEGGLAVGEPPRRPTSSRVV